MAQSDSPAATLVGAWRLVSYELAGSDGRVRRPYGPAPAGLLLYSADGYMSVAFAQPDRPGFASGNVLRGTPAEWAACAKTYTSYAGRYEVQEDRVLHHLEVSLYPDWLGTTQERFFTLVGDRLTLRMPPYQQSSVQWLGTLIWERAGKTI
jgi:hypothetical protein